MEIISKSVNSTLRIGSQIAKELKPTSIICLFGNLGSGKTVLTKGIARGLGISPSNIISPSFVLLRQYTKGRLSLFHFDLYRLTETKDIAGLGFEEYFYGEGVTVIEWAERLGRLMPEEFLRIELAVKGSLQRKIKITAFGERYKNVIASLRSQRRNYKL
jgi:tRNA threonylcarbamoyladenosine biosynthesis protein TsaE